MKKYIILVIETIVVIGLLCLAKFLPSTSSKALNLVINTSIYYMMGISAIIALKLSGLTIDFEWKNYKQYLIGLCIALCLALVLGVIPQLFGVRLAGPHQDFNISYFLSEFFYLLLVIGPVEEIIFRVYYQKAFVSILPKYRWLAVIISATLFGLFHILNSWINVLFAFIIGLVLGFAKEYIKDLHYPGITLAHGLYDFLLYVVTLIF